ncbi:hypothetical protein EJ03DRAFT_353951 [Teratosphaeria nubilosa]|uniref:Uncharacterized protein n=1 Tax=Teratosphaeria nubilosa TaxID=161662 RepID=A0A6G1L0X2_9PEZI|nr:hypothetical protein EJ03DRAFT_353951 [Teratosphaeria nubilosa]
MNVTRSPSPTSWPYGAIISAQSMVTLYIIVGALIYIPARIILHHLLWTLLTKTRIRMFAFLMPWTCPTALALYPMAVHYLTHYGFVLNMPGAFKIRLWPRLAPPDCQAAKDVLGDSSVCYIDRLNNWIRLTSLQPDGLVRSLRSLPMGPTVLFFGIMAFFIFCGWKTVEDWGDAVRKDRVDRFIGWEYGGVEEYDKDDDLLYLRREFGDLLRRGRIHQSVRWQRDGTWAWEGGDDPGAEDKSKACFAEV